MPRSRYGQFLLYSLLLHLLLVGFFSSGLISMQPPPPDLSADTTLTLIEQPPPPQPRPIVKQSGNFVPTVSSQSVAQANPNAPLESEFNTQQKSAAPARDPNSAMPDMRGDPRAGLNYYDVASVPSQQQPAPQNNPKTPDKQTPDKPQALTPPKPKQIASAEQVKPLTQPDNALPLLPEKQQPKPEPEQPRPPVEPQTASRPPPSAPSFSLSRSRSDIRGGGAESDLPSPESKESELGRYKSKIYRAIGSRWYLNVDRAMTDLSIGTVRIKFYIQANGVVSNVEVLEDTGSQILHTISLKAILDSAPFEPFPESLKQQLGAGYDEEFTFSIY